MAPFDMILDMVDLFLITPYRWPHNPVLGWWLGTMFVGIWCVILGEMSLALVFRVNRARVKEVSQELTEFHAGSMNALKAGDKKAFKDINRLANEAYGKHFFMQVSMACASLWPAALALGWMQTRFSGVDFPLPFVFPMIGNTVGYPFAFIPLYILIRILFEKAKGVRSRQVSGPQASGR